MEATLLTKEQVFGNKKLNIFEKIGTKCAITDFAITLGVKAFDIFVDYDNTLKGCTGTYFLLDANGYGDVLGIDENGDEPRYYASCDRVRGIRPVITIPNSIVSSINNIEIEFGEYPQYTVDIILEKQLEQAYLSGNLRKTGKIYTTDSRKWGEYTLSFQASEYEEYEYNGKKYIRACCKNHDKYELFSNGVKVENK